MNDSELREIRIMLEVLLKDRELTAWVDSWAVGANKGGPYVSLFHSRLKYRVCHVYHEQFKLLPAFIRDQIPTGAADLPDVDNDREKLAAADAKRPEGKRVLRECTPFLAARLRDPGKDEDKAAWKLAGVIRVARERQQAQEQTPAQRPAPTPAPAGAPESAPVAISFATREDAIHYGCQRGVYVTYADAEVEYERIKAEKKPTNSSAMFALWVEHVEGQVETHKKFDASATGYTNPPADEGTISRPHLDGPGVRKGPEGAPSKRMAARVKSEPAYAG